MRRNEIIVFEVLFDQNGFLDAPFFKPQFSYMKYSTLLIAVILSVAIAEKYAIIFGTAKGWSNYSITSVHVNWIFHS